MIKVECLAEGRLSERLILPSKPIDGPIELSRRRVLATGGVAMASLALPPLISSPALAEGDWRGNPIYALARGLQLVAKVIENVAKILKEIGEDVGEVEDIMDGRIRVSPPQALLVAANPTRKTLKYDANYVLSDQLVATGELNSRLDNGQILDSMLLDFAKTNVKASKELHYNVPPKHYAIYRIDGDRPLDAGRYVTAILAPNNHDTDVSMLRVIT